MLEIYPQDIRRAFRRSRIRAAVLLALAILRRATAADIARLAGVEIERVHAAMFGDDEDYRIDQSLIPLGLTILIPTEEGTLYEITPYGVRVADALRRDMMRALLVTPSVRT